MNKKIVFGDLLFYAFHTTCPWLQLAGLDKHQLFLMLQFEFQQVVMEEPYSGLTKAQGLVHKLREMI